MRGFISLLFVAALAAHLGPAGAPSLVGAPACAEEVGFGGHAGSQDLYPATILAGTQGQATPEGREGPGSVGPRRVAPQTGTSPLRNAVGGASRSTAVTTPACLLGFAGHPTTAPPLQA